MGVRRAPIQNNILLLCSNLIREDVQNAEVLHYSALPSLSEDP